MHSEAHKYKAIRLVAVLFQLDAVMALPVQHWTKQLLFLTRSPRLSGRNSFEGESMYSKVKEKLDFTKYDINIFS